MVPTRRDGHINRRVDIGLNIGLVRKCRNQLDNVHRRHAPPPPPPCRYVPADDILRSARKPNRVWRRPRHLKAAYNRWPRERIVVCYGNKASHDAGNGMSKPPAELGHRIFDS